MQLYTLQSQLNNIIGYRFANMITI